MGESDLKRRYDWTTNANYEIGIGMSGVSAISYTLNSCGRHERFACSLRIS